MHQGHSASGIEKRVRVGGANPHWQLGLAARGGAGADSSCFGVGGVAPQRANAISLLIRYSLFREGLRETPLTANKERC